MLLYIFVTLMLLFLGTVFFGAPYVPTRAHDVRLTIAMLKPSDVLVDLGSGDGRLVRAAANKKIKAYGVELSPILALISWVHTIPVRARARIRFGNYWHMNLPDDTTVVFVFLAGKYMERLKRFLEQEATRLGRPIKLISYGFDLPGYERDMTESALLVYTIKPKKT